MNAAQVSRNNLRGAFLFGLSRGKKKPIEDVESNKARVKLLLDAHYACSRPARSVVLSDVKTMLEEGYAKITVERERSKKTLTPRKLLPEEICIIQEWYDAKMEVLKGEMGAQTDEIAAEVEAVGEGQRWRPTGKRTDIRRQLLSGKRRMANSQGQFKDLDEEQWLVPHWDAYIKLNFELPYPGAPKAVEELRKMVDSHRTLDYEGRKNCDKARPIASRRLGDLEFAKLEGLLPIYKEKLKALRGGGDCLGARVDGAVEGVEEAWAEAGVGLNTSTEALCGSSGVHSCRHFSS